jgi:tetratricopeptide (TPR) repeat protein
LIKAKRSPLPSTGSPIFDKVVKRWTAFDEQDRPRSYREALQEFSQLAETWGIPALEQQLQSKQPKKPATPPHKNNTPFNLLFNKAVAADKIQRFDMAERFLARALTEDPSQINAYIGRASFLTMLGRRREAIEVYDRGIALNPKAWELYSHRFYENLQAKRFEDATKDMDRALRLVPWHRRRKLRAEIDDHLRLAGVTNPNEDILKQIRDNPRSSLKKELESSGRSNPFLDDDDDDAVDEADGLSAIIKLVEMERHVLEDRRLPSTVDDLDSSDSGELTFERVGNISISALEDKADYSRAMALLRREGLRPLSYQEAFVSIDQSSELKKCLKGKAFWLAGDEIQATGIHEFNRAGELVKVERMTDRERTVEILPGYYPLTLWVTPDGGDHERFTLSADWQPEEKLASSAVGLPQAFDLIGVSKPQNTVPSRAVGNPIDGELIVEGLVTYVQTMAIVKRHGARLLYLSELPRYIQSGLLERLVRVHARETKSRHAGFLTFFLADESLAMNGHYIFDASQSTLNTMFRQVSKADWMKVQFANRTLFSGGGGPLQVQFAEPRMEIDSMGCLSIHAYGEHGLRILVSTVVGTKEPRA